jgi:type I restriction enzyme S subunit
MKSSDIEWIGDIPADWEIGRIKYCYEIIPGKMLQPFQSRSADKELNYMCSANVTWDRINLSVLKQMWFSPSEIKTYLLQKGDLFVAEGGDVAVATEMEQQIEILKQYKISFITEMVTRGLNKAVPMKDSGIDWIRKIPAHWEMGRVKYCYDIILGKMLQPFQEKSTDREMNYMCSVNVTWNGIDLSVLKEMWFTPSEIKTYLLQKGDLLVVEGGDVAIASIWNNEIEDCCIQNALHLIRENGKHSNGFLYYWLYFLKHNGYIDLVCNKATIAHFTKEKNGESPLCVLPLAEQEKIANYLDDKIKKTDDLIAAKRQSIKTMRAYKKSLIYEYVTGKKRVKGYR